MLKHNKVALHTHQRIMVILSIKEFHIASCTSQHKCRIVYTYKIISSQNGECGNLSLIRLLKELISIPHSHTLQSFLVPNVVELTGYFSLERPIVARRLRFVINSGVIDPNFGRLCWRIQLFGCLHSRGMQYNIIILQ